MVSTRNKELHFSAESPIMVGLNRLLNNFGVRAMYSPSMFIKDFPMYSIVGRGNVNSLVVRQTVNAHFKSKNMKVVWDIKLPLFWVLPL